MAGFFSQPEIDRSAAANKLGLRGKENTKNP
jgi:hypothetical protein